MSENEKQNTPKPRKSFKQRREERLKNVEQTTDQPAETPQTQPTKAVGVEKNETPSRETKPQKPDIPSERPYENEAYQQSKQEQKSKPTSFKKEDKGRGEASYKKPYESRGSERDNGPDKPDRSRRTFDKSPRKFDNDRPESRSANRSESRFKSNRSENRFDDRPSRSDSPDRPSAFKKTGNKRQEDEQRRRRAFKPKDDTPREKEDKIFHYYEQGQIKNGRERPFLMTAKTLQGLEEVLAQELKDLGAADIQIDKRAVSFRGDTPLLYKANLHLRTAINIMLPLVTLRADDPDELYEQLLTIDWQKYLSSKQTFVVQSTVYSDNFTHSHYASLRLKDAIVDRFKEKDGSRPSVDTDNPDVTFHLHITGNRCTVMLNSSGEPLFKRGYRRVQGPAPLNEVLAAGIIKLSGWKADRPFLDPMCGAGTLVIEAAMIASHTAPGLLRESFGFQNWPNYRQGLWDKLIAEADQAIQPVPVLIQGSDSSEEAIKTANANIQQAGVKSFITLEQLPFEETGSTNTFVIFNPPYDERLEIDTEEPKAFYKHIGDTLKNQHTGSQAAVLCPFGPLSKSVGLKPKVRIPLMNGNIDCRLLIFDLF